MESLVSYGSDDEGSEHYQELKDPIYDEMDIREKHRVDDTNYDNVQMDMSEDSNNNNSSSDSEDEKSSSRSSTSTSSSSDSRERSNLPSSPPPLPVNKKYSPPPPKDFKAEKDDKWNQESSKGHEKMSKHVDRDYGRDSRDAAKHSRDKEKSRHGDRHSREKNSRSDRDRRSRSRDRRSRSRDRHDRRSKSQSKSKDVDSKRYNSSPDDSRRSRSPEYRHSSSYSKHSDVYRSSRSSHNKDHERTRRSKSRERSRRRSRSRDRQRSRSRDRRSRSKEHRRRGYDKKRNKLTVLERLGIELRAPEIPPAVTPQQLLQRSIEAQVQQVKSNTGIELPKYYNPAAMNPARYAEQMQKRKLLWGNKSAPKVEPSAETVVKPAPQTSNNKWEGTTFAQDQDGKMTAKFKRLMGIKDAAPSGPSSSASIPAPSNAGSELLKKQEELFNSMEMQYEVARVATHTHRGVGLGFGTFQYPR